MINGKAMLTREDYCDGLGDCLPACPADAIHFEEREAPAYDEAAVLAAKEKKASGEVPCCGGIAHAVKAALQASGKFIPWKIVTISIDGNILDE